MKIIIFFKKFHSLKYACLIFLLSLCSVNLNAQDAQYWNLSYGTQATVLGGTVIGSVTDLSSTFYNPGMLGLKTEPELIIGAKMLEYSTLTMEHPSADRMQLSSSTFQPSPSFVAGSFKSDSTSSNRFAFSILVRQYFDFNLESHLATSTFNDNGESVDVSGQIILNQDLIETWGTVTFGQRIFKDVGLGISQYFAVRNHVKRAEVISNVRNNINEIETIERVRSYDYFNVRTLWKIGIGIEKQLYSLGLTITTPSINLFGSGDAFLNDILNNVESEDSQLPENFMTANYQQDLKSIYKSPWSIGIGGAYTIDKTTINLSAEWFSALNEYSVLSTEEFQSQTTGATLTNDLTHETRSIVNYGIGAEFSFIKSFSGFGGIVTDFSTIKSGSEQNLMVSNYDIYHITGGGIVKFGRSKITLGFEYSFGSTTGLELNTQNYRDTIFNDLADEIEISYNRYKIIFAFLLQL